MQQRLSEWDLHCHPHMRYALGMITVRVLPDIRSRHHHRLYNDIENGPLAA